MDSFLVDAPGVAALTGVLPYCRDIILAALARSGWEARSPNTLRYHPKIRDDAVLEIMLLDPVYLIISIQMLAARNRLAVVVADFPNALAVEDSPLTPIGSGVELMEDQGESPLFREPPAPRQSDRQELAAGRLTARLEAALETAPPLPLDTSSGPARPRYRHLEF